MLNFLEVSLLGDHYFGHGSRVSFEGLNNGTSWKPFVYRVLVPKVTRAVTEITPTSWRESINNGLYDLRTTSLFVSFKTSMPWLMELFPNKHTIYSRLVCILIVYGCLIGYIIMLQKLSHALFPRTPLIALIAPVVALPVIVALSRPMQYPYDMAVLFLSASCYYCLLTKQFQRYFFLFFLACLNKESAVFIAIFFVFWFFEKMDVRTYVKYALAQAVIFATTKAIITWTYLHNTGHFLERRTERIWAYEWLQMHHISRIAMLLGLVLLLAYRWRDKPPFLKCSLMLIPYALTAYILFGAPGEYRVFFDILPLIILLIAHSLVELSVTSYQSFAAR